MDLYSVNKHGSWNALTSLIVFDSAVCDREFYAAPVVEYTGKDYSTIFHELTHLWCGRTTRLGWLLSRTAADCFMKWKQDKNAFISITESAHSLLCTYTPIMEGLAMYTQLDYRTETDENNLPSPILIFSEITDLRMKNIKLDTLFLNIKEDAIFQRSKENFGLLELLFLNCERPDLCFYLIGYLYIKAIETALSRRCNRFSKPNIFLPFIIRLLCDHPIIEKGLTQRVQEKVIIDTLHSCVLNLSTTELQGIANLLERNDKLRLNFDHWDLHAQLESQRFDEPIFHGEKSISSFFDVHANDEFSKLCIELRSCSSVHLLSWIDGKLMGISDDGMKMKLSCDSGEKIIHTTQFVLDRLKAYIQQDITVGTFYTLTKGNYGIAIWSANSLIDCIPFLPPLNNNVKEITPFYDEVEIKTLFYGLWISPSDRISFSKSLSTPDWEKSRINSAMEVILEKLVSLKENRRHIVAQKFCLNMGKYITDFKRWCNPDPDRHHSEQLPNEVLQAMDKIFDLPGFQLLPCENQIKFSDLLPTLNPPYFTS